MISPHGRMLPFPVPRRDSHHGALPASGAEMETGAMGLPVGFLLANAYLAAIHPVNMLLGTNYGFTVATPAGGSVLDFLGPWPGTCCGCSSCAGADVPAHASLPPLSQGPHGQFPAPPLKWDFPLFRLNSRENVPPVSQKKSPDRPLLYNRLKDADVGVRCPGSAINGIHPDLMVCTGCL